MNVSVLWTGGKDSCLALLMAREQGWRVVDLTMFVPNGKVEFQSHPLPLVRRQAEALKLPLKLLKVGEPYREGYVAAFKAMKDVEAVITGDIDLVDGYPNWVRECVADSGADLRVVTPLWQRDRLGILRDLIARKVEARLTRIVHEAVPQDWVGRVIDEHLIESLAVLSAKHGVDPCGENGEYHTMVDWCPGFRFRVGAGMPRP